MDGIINVYKEKGYTSFDVVAKLRGILKTRKIGHTGTLDPMAEGVLPVCLGSATKLVDDITGTSKTYIAEMILGVSYDTLDTTGELLEKRDVNVSEEEVRQAVASFIGEQDQIPPMFSAVKINGVKLYDMARKGKVVERKPRRITIHSIEVMDINLNAETPTVRISVECSKGTYIRSLISDIGDKLGTLAAMSELTRTKTGSFTVDKAYTIDQIEEYFKSGRLGSIISYVDDYFIDFPPLTVKKDEMLYAENGNRLLVSSFEEEEELKDKAGGMYRIYSHPEDGIFYGVYSFDSKRGDFKPERMFFARR